MDQITQVGINPTHLTFLPKGPDSVNTFTLVQSIHSFYFLLLIKKKKTRSALQLLELITQQIYTYLEMISTEQNVNNPVILWQASSTWHISDSSTAFIQGCKSETTLDEQVEERILVPTLCPRIQTTNFPQRWNFHEVQQGARGCRESVIAFRLIES